MDNRGPVEHHLHARVVPTGRTSTVVVPGSMGVAKPRTNFISRDPIEGIHGAEVR